MGVRVIDWEPIRMAYVSSLKSYSQLAREYDIGVNIIARRGAADGWVAARAEFRRRVQREVIDQRKDVEVDRLNGILDAAMRIEDEIAAALTDKDQFRRHLVSETEIDEDGGRTVTTVEKVFDKRDTRAIRDLTAAMRELTSVIRNVTGLPTQAEREAQRIAAERLELDKRKVDAADGVDKEIRVVMEGGWKEHQANDS